MGAAKTGAEVILAERYGFLGGNATAALVMPLMSFHTQQPRREKEGSDHAAPDGSWSGRSRGSWSPDQVLERLVTAGGAISPSLKTGYVVPFDPEIFKLVALDLFDEAGVDFLFHAFATNVFADDIKKCCVRD